MPIPFRFAFGVACAAALLAPPSPSLADDAVRNAAERVGDRRELRDDRRELRDDQGDRLEIERLRDEFAAASAAGDASALAALDAQVESYLAVELGEAKGEVHDAKKELRRDRREVRSDRREIRDNRRTAAAPGERADDRRDLRDDRRDRRDDRRDLTREKVQAWSLGEIREDWVALSDDISRADAIATKRILLDGLSDKARAEMGQGVREVREDRRELREDRRETREDRREG